MNIFDFLLNSQAFTNVFSQSRTSTLVQPDNRSDLLSESLKRVKKLDSALKQVLHCIFSLKEIAFESAVLKPKEAFLATFAAKFKR